MKKMLCFVILLLFIFNSNKITYSSIQALNIWSKNVFPILFPTLVLGDFILSSGLINSLLNKIKINSSYAYILLISIITGTPTNSKILLDLYNSNNLNKKDLNIIISSTLLFNPFFVIKFTNIKIYLIILLANIITIKKNIKNISKYNNTYIKDFNLFESINNNINILLNILGILTIFINVVNVFKTKYVIINIIIASILEVTSGLSLINIFITNPYLKDILYLFALSFGGLSIFMQIKSILKDTFSNYKLYFTNRILVFILSIIFINLLKHVIFHFYYLIY